MLPELDPDVSDVLEALELLGLPDISERTVAQAREDHAKRTLPAGPAMDVEDHVLKAPHGPVPARVYRPAPRDDLPCMVWFHGGGFVLGSVDGHDSLCRMLADGSGCAVVSVEYRLAPEHKFPAAIEDAVAALRLVQASSAALRVDGTRMAVAGDSAGATLATVSSTLVTRDDSARVAMQLLFYPVADLRTFDRDSHQDYGEGHFLTRAAMLWFRDHYLPSPGLAADPRVSPLANPDLSGLPAAHVILAECDVLHDEGLAYARALRDAGVPTTVSDYPGVIHAFASMYPVVERGREAISEAADALRETLQP